MDAQDTPATGLFQGKERTEGAERPSARPQTGLGPLNHRQRAVLAEAPISARGILDRAYSGKSKAAGIKAMCLRCVGYVRQDVTDCTSLGCPLWPYRPFQRDDEAEDAA